MDWAFQKKLPTVMLLYKILAEVLVGMLLKFGAD